MASKKKSKAKKRMLYVQTSGVDTPERLYAPFILGATAAAMDLEPTIYFLIKGVTVVKRGAAERVKVGTFPGLREVMDQALQAGVKLMVCDQSSHLMGLQPGDTSRRPRWWGRRPSTTSYWRRME